jgi:hypothetical protein
LQRDRALAITATTGAVETRRTEQFDLTRIMATTSLQNVEHSGLSNQSRCQIQRVLNEMILMIEVVDCSCSRLIYEQVVYPSPLCAKLHGPFHAVSFQTSLRSS